jgi:hypothetical protein
MVEAVPIAANNLKGTVLLFAIRTRHYCAGVVRGEVASLEALSGAAGVIAICRVAVPGTMMCW